MTARGVLAGQMPFESSLRDALGDRLRVLPDDCARFAVAGRIPSAVASPRSLTKIALVLRAATAEGAVVAIRGAGTKSRRPPPPRAIDVVLDASAWKGVVRHPAADLTVTVRSGTSLHALDDALREAGQFWPCDAPFAKEATVGGTIAAAANGALRQRYGGLRDLVLGARMIDARGVAVDTGARVVKSVAGYDLHKLLVGSWGTLGYIAEVTLKVAALPDDQRAVCASFDDCAAAVAASSAIARSPAFPIATALHDARSARRIGALAAIAPRSGWLLIVRTAGNRRSAQAAARLAAVRCREAGANAIDEVERPELLRAWEDVRELAGGAAYASDAYAVLKIVSLPAATAATIAAARDAWPSAEITAHPAAGVALIHVPIAADAERATPLPALALPDRAHAWSTWLRAPDGASPFLPGAAAQPLLVALLRSVKAAFDPDGTLDPGRLPGGV